MRSAGLRVGKQASWTSAKASAMAASVRTTAKRPSALARRTLATGSGLRAQRVLERARHDVEAPPQLLLGRDQGHEQADDVVVRARAQEQQAPVARQLEDARGAHGRGLAHERVLDDLQ